jgi:hypothetical protein
MDGLLSLPYRRFYRRYVRGITATLLTAPSLEYRMSPKERSPLTIAAEVAGVLALFLGVLELINNFTGVGPAPITYLWNQTQEGNNTVPSGPQNPGPEDSLPLADTEPPSVPQNLHIDSNTSTATGGCSIVLAWDPSTDNRGLQSYRIYANGAFRGLAPSGFSSHEASLFPGDQESYTITAFDGSNESGHSNTVEATC